jgi:2-polyprenyl-3-methyl-5-hydroxy-6-metoxy-1,4-benzoquinol methylase
MIKSIVSKKYWDTTWENSTMPKEIEYGDKKLKNTVNIEFDKIFSKILSQANLQQTSLLEVGCANSAWLPYFKKRFGFEVSGLDYSELGCKKSMDFLAHEGVVGNIYCEDFFNDDSDLVGKFDIVVSFGVVEHFENTAATLEALAKYLKPDGVLITIVPNLSGIIGFIQKRLDRKVFDLHICLDKPALIESAKKARLKTILVDYLVPLNFGILNTNCIKKTNLFYPIKRLLMILLSRASLLVWFIDKILLKIKTNRTNGSYLISVATKSNYAV